MLIPRIIPPFLKESRRAEESLNINDIEVVMSAFRSLRSINPIGYLSIPTTTGELFYSVLEKYGVITQGELLAINQDLIFDEVIVPNAEIGKTLGDELAAKWNIPIIVPTVLEARSKRWSQADYMYLWYQVIREMTGHLFSGDGWEVSNGGSKEFVYSLEMQFRLIPTLCDGCGFPQYLLVDLYPEKFIGYEFPKEFKITDQRGLDINIETGAELIAKAIINLYGRGFRPQSLLVALRQLVGIAEAIDSAVSRNVLKIDITPNHLLDKKQVNDFWQEAFFCSNESFEDICHCYYNS